MTSVAVLVVDLTNRSFVDSFVGPTALAADSSLRSVVAVGRRMLSVVPVEWFTHK